MDINALEIQSMKDRGMSWHDIGLVLAERYGGDAYLLQERARKKVARYRKQNTLKNGDKTSEISEKLYKIDEDDLLDTESMMMIHGYDPSEWTLVDSSCTIKQNTINTRIKVRPSTLPHINTDKLAKAIREALNDITVEEHDYKMPVNKDTAFVTAFDIHYGKKFRHMNHTKTKDDVLHAVHEIARHLRMTKPREIVLPLGQDFFNSGTTTHTTTKGTPQIDSLEWYEMYSQGVSLAVSMIEILRTVSPVRVIHSRGNHDEMLTYTMVSEIKRKYENVDDIIVELTNDTRTYTELDNVLVGVSHNYEERDLSTNMQTEARESWGRCEHHYWLTGHLHHLEMMEKNGVTIFKCPSMAFTDEFHERHGYTDARRAMACFTFNREGLKEIYFGSPRGR